MKSIPAKQLAFDQEAARHRVVVESCPRVKSTPKKRARGATSFSKELGAPTVTRRVTVAKESS